MLPIACLPPGLLRNAVPAAWNPMEESIEPFPQTFTRLRDVSPAPGKETGPWLTRKPRCSSLLKFSPKSR